MSSSPSSPEGREWGAPQASLWGTGWFRGPHRTVGYPVTAAGMGGPSLYPHSPSPQACRLQKLFGTDGDLADEVRDGDGTCLAPVTALGTPPGSGTTPTPTGVALNPPPPGWWVPVVVVTR